MIKSYANTLSTAVSQVMNFNDLDVPLNQIRRINKVQEETLDGLKSRLNHLNSQDKLTESKVKRTQQEINQLVYIKEQKAHEFQRKKSHQIDKGNQLQQSQQYVQQLRTDGKLRSNSIENIKKIYSLTHLQNHKNYKNKIQSKKILQSYEIDTENKDCYSKIRSQHEMQLIQKIQRQQDLKQMSLQNYAAKVEFEKSLYKYRQSAIQHLEGEESLLVSRLQISQQKHRSTSEAKEEISRKSFTEFSPKKNLFKIN